MQHFLDDCRGIPDIQGQSFVEYFICTGLMNGETKPIKGFAVVDFPTDLLITLLNNGEVVTQTVPDFIHNKMSIANKYINEDDRTDDQEDNSNNVIFIQILKNIIFFSTISVNAFSYRRSVETISM